VISLLRKYLTKVSKTKVSKKVSLIVATFFFILVASSMFGAFNQVGAQAQLDQSPRAQAIRQAGKLVVGISAPYEPAVFTDPSTGKWAGFDVDIAQAIAAKIGVPIEWKNMVFEELLTSQSSGKFDLALSSITITPERQKTLDFSEGYYKAGLSLVVNRCNKSITSIKALVGRAVGATKGTTSGKYLQKLQQDGTKITIKEYKGEREMLSALRDGDVDAVVNGSINSGVILKRAADLKFAGELIQPEYIGIAVKKGDQGLLQTINGVIQQLRSQGRLNALFERWLNSQQN